MLLGQALGVAEARERGIAVHAGSFAFGVALTCAYLIFIVCLNDWADAPVDTLKRRMFPDGGSPKTIPDGVLPATSLLRVGLGAGVVAAVVSCAAAWSTGRVSVAILGIGGLLFFVAYSLPPVRLNYRGGGELLEALGVGGVLPWVNGEMHASLMGTALLHSLSGFVLLSLASAIASGISDEQSDRAGKKRTVVTLLGNAEARRLVSVLPLASASLWVAQAHLVRAATLAPAAICIFGAISLFFGGRGAVTNAFDAHRRYKTLLHAIIWSAGVVLAVGVLVAPGLLP